jgi:hypothetical protein
VQTRFGSRKKLGGDLGNFFAQPPHGGYLDVRPPGSPLQYFIVKMSGIDPPCHLYYWFGVGEATLHIHHLNSDFTPHPSFTTRYTINHGNHSLVYGQSR